jgi:hypothetical protein
MRNRSILAFVSPKSVPGVLATCHPKGWLRWRNSTFAVLPVLPVLGWQVASPGISMIFGHADEFVIATYLDLPPTLAGKGYRRGPNQEELCQSDSVGLGEFGETESRVALSNVGQDSPLGLWRRCAPLGSGWLPIYGAGRHDGGDGKA